MSNSQTFPNASGFNLAFTNVAATETDSGSVTPFIGQTSSFDLLPVGGGMIEWAGFHTGAIAPGGSETLDFTYDVTSTNPADAITRLGLSMVPDSAVATGVSLTARARRRAVAICSSFPWTAAAAVAVETCAN